MGSLLIGCVGLFSAGCQTFNLSEEQFAKQQRGGVVDKQTGEAVAIGGTAAYVGATVAALATAHW